MFDFACQLGKIPMSAPTSRFLSKYKNNFEFINNYLQYILLDLDLFIYDNAPPEFNQRFFEMSLLYEGSSCMVKREDGGYISMFFRSGGTLNVNGELLKGMGYGMNGTHIDNLSMYLDGMENKAIREGYSGVEFPLEYNAVMCRDNKMCYPYIRYIMSYAERITSAMRGLDVIRSDMKTPTIIQAPEHERISVKDMLTRREENQSAIIFQKKNSTEFKTFDIKVRPEMLSVGWEDVQQLKCSILEILGIESNPQVDKKERLLVDEVNSNNSVTHRNLLMRLREREVFCERVNKAFGLNMSVRLREEGEDYNENDDVSGLVSETGESE